MANHREERLLGVMTCNIHSCIGVDKTISPERIAKVIARYKPDIAALQEVDSGRIRTGKNDQALIIAEDLKMYYHYHPSIHIAEAKYGIAVLSRYPFEPVKSEILPGFRNNLESRSAIWLKINVEGVFLNLLNTHLGLRPGERRIQTKALTGQEWLTAPDCNCPIIMCGDFNALPCSYPYRTFNWILRDVQNDANNHKPKATWSSRYPVIRIDHLFISSGIETRRVNVPRTGLERAASDHLPLIADIRIPDFIQRLDNKRQWKKDKY